ncbi:MAG: hypothetical protein PUE34_04925, partial [Clostridiaceae bacterium]|nr:hypothetical protein [Clostridiaceae bacterium]
DGIVNYTPYYCAPAEQVNWVAKNIFNIEKLSFDKYITKDPGFLYNNATESVEIYLYENNYYAKAHQYGRGPDYSYIVSDSKRLDDGKYEIYIDRKISEYPDVDVKDSLVEKENAITITAGLKNIDGKRVWSYYKIVGNP